MDQFLDYTVHLLSLNECIHAYTVTKLQMYDLEDFLKIINIPYTSVSSGIWDSKFQIPLSVVVYEINLEIPLLVDVFGFKYYR